MRLQAKLLFLITPFLVIPLLIFGGYVYISQFNATIESTSLSANTKIEKIGAKIAERINVAKANANLLASYFKVFKSNKYALT